MSIKTKVFVMQGNSQNGWCFLIFFYDQMVNLKTNRPLICQPFLRKYAVFRHIIIILIYCSYYADHSNSNFPSFLEWFRTCELLVKLLNYLKMLPFMVTLNTLLQY